jgi:hypothetical protein
MAVFYFGDLTSFSLISVRLVYSTTYPAVLPHSLWQASKRRLGTWWLQSSLPAIIMRLEGRPHSQMAVFYFGVSRLGESSAMPDISKEQRCSS